MNKNNGKKTQTNSFLDRIDIPGTEWIAAYGREFILVHNPAFVAEPMHPYNLGMAMGIFCEKGSVEGKVNMDNFTIAEGGLLADECAALLSRQGRGPGAEPLFAGLHRA